ncbi:hypothetical protein VTN00DRAFT_7389 [Thermoascus crustaceus]|uniref:uncharacterized protein n=1 Tax=Thermoascus crustaceus TaxID=5088 RepID=UPI003743C17A
MSFHVTSELVRIEVDNNGTWLCCSARAEDGEMIPNRFRLDDGIGNSDGFFSREESEFTLSAKHIELEHRPDGPWLCADLPMRDGGYRQRQGINLALHIRNENGQLCFILSGTQRVKDELAPYRNAITAEYLGRRDDDVHIVLVIYCWLRPEVLQHGSHFETTFQPGKTIGQRYDVIVNATASPGNYWMRAIPCSENANEHNIRGIIRYDSSSTDDPESTAWDQTVSVCEDENFSSLVPYLSLDAGEEDYRVLLNVMLKTNPFRWYINDTTMAVEWDNLTLKQIYLNQTDWESSEAVYELTTANEWVYVIVHSSAHPIHLHGHGFYVLASGNGNYSDSRPLQTRNLPRRDVALLPANGHLVIAFKADNPGAWLMHCHIGWHTGQGFSIQIVERAAELRNLIDYDALNQTCANWDAFTAKTGLDDPTVHSGV